MGSIPELLQDISTGLTKMYLHAVPGLSHVSIRSPDLPIEAYLVLQRFGIGVQEESCGVPGLRIPAKQSSEFSGYGRDITFFLELHP
jgi:hypothetical protein